MKSLPFTGIFIVVLVSLIWALGKYTAGFDSNLAGLFSSVIAIVVFLKGLAEYEKGLKIKRAEFLDKLIKEFIEPGSELAKLMLDDFVYVKPDDRAKPVEEQKELGVSLSIYLRDHDGLPITSVDEIKVRRSFDSLLDFFSRLSYYLKQELISAPELSYFKYYLIKIKKNTAVKNYIDRYFYAEDFELLFEAIEKTNKKDTITMLRL